MKDLNSIEMEIISLEGQLVILNILDCNEPINSQLRTSYFERKANLQIRIDQLKSKIEELRSKARTQKQKSRH